MMTVSLSFKDFYAARKDAVDFRLRTLVPENSPYHASLFEAARYSLLSSAKRLRPLLALAVAETYGVSHLQAVNAACALELIHTYSLIHDDLPCMDDDDFRRGRPTLHKVFGESTALLAGDYLLTRAFEIIAKDPHLTSDKKVELIQILSERAGGDGMIGGQVMDLEAETAPPALSLLEIIHAKKTGCMILAAVEFGACLAGSPPDERTHLEAYAKEVGIAFQIIDDVLDETGSFEEMGKKPHSDLNNHKTTFATLLGIEEAKVRGALHLERAKAHLDNLPRDTTLLKQFADFAVNRRY
ncbi:polyprenyl synthetase family protein [Estrella lausannensis]|uniref:Farnesyl diphosphate synthase n=1 Tax=Estrella lausannensis TaxID=483423 RepID=A0A0H5DR31_9BACT|nr:farnesyl diphosphate synthase [Estrella lausannensis]CRX38084.1 Farnesyl diphosphate synthase [Estrella lausannensis]